MIAEVPHISYVAFLDGFSIGRARVSTMGSSFQMTFLECSSIRSSMRSSNNPWGGFWGSGVEVEVPRSGEHDPGPAARWHPRRRRPWWGGKRKKKQSMKQKWGKPSQQPSARTQLSTRPGIGSRSHQPAPPQINVAWILDPCRRSSRGLSRNGDSPRLC